VPTDFQRLFELSPLPAYVVDDVTLHFLAVNDAAVEQYGHARTDFLRLTIEDIWAVDEVARMRATLREHIGDPRWRGVVRHRRRDGVIFDAEVSSHPVMYEGQPAHFVVAADVTERQTIQTRLGEAHEQLRRISSRARARREEDRTRMARELHDQLGQALAGLKIDLHWLHERIVDRKATDDDLADKIGVMDRLLDDTIWRVRRLSTELRPPVLDKLGLLAAIDWQAEEFGRRTGLRMRVRSAIEFVELDRGRATSVFRMFQEALTNIATHANATAATIRLSTKGGRLILTISDNGVGMRTEHFADRQSLGLLGMRERAALLGGEVEIRPKHPRGTSIVIAIPTADRRQSPREDWT
jgi:PAS domain S-box-containing protein